MHTISDLSSYFFYPPSHIVRGADRAKIKIAPLYRSNSQHHHPNEFWAKKRSKKLLNQILKQTSRKRCRGWDRSRIPAPNFESTPSPPAAVLASSRGPFGASRLCAPSFYRKTITITVYNHYYALFLRSRRSPVGFAAVLPPLPPRSPSQWPPLHGGPQGHARARGGLHRNTGRGRALPPFPVPAFAIYITWACVGRMR